MGTPEDRIDRIGMWVLSVLIFWWILFSGPCQIDPSAEQSLRNLESRTKMLEERTHNVETIHWDWIKALCEDTDLMTGRKDCPQ